MILIHSDNKGLVVPPRVAENKIVIVPLLFKGKEDIVLEKARELKEALGNELNAFIDDRREYSPGFKINEWEIKGIPIRIEIGPRDIEKEVFTLVRRDDNSKKEIRFNSKGFNMKKNNWKKNIPITKRNVIHIILRNPRTDKFLCLNWKKVFWNSFISGGIEDNESLESAGRREVLEETGYKNLKFIEELNVETYDKFYAPHKNTNRFIRNKVVVFDLIDETQEDIDKKELDLHELVWVKKKEVESFLNIDSLKFIWDYYLNKKKSINITNLREIIEDELEEMHNNLFSKAKIMMESKTIEVNNYSDFKKAIMNGKRCLVPWFESIESEIKIKEETGAKSSCIPFRFNDKSLKGIKCFYSGKQANCWVYFAKSY